MLSFNIAVIPRCKQAIGWQTNNVVQIRTRAKLSQPIMYEAAYVWLNPLASLLHGQTMVDHMVDHSGPNLIRDNGFPSCSSSSSFSSSSYSHSSASLITSYFNVAIHCSPNQELTCGPYIAKALISNCTTALEI